ncbi:exodeoxyribonuclease V, beta subunit [Oceanimonas sp. GK1]|uniref:exodeoxyribonuclease V subunit beta n=1 Tax=Oceanimonas sp. (strain GK1 / IBRC-M 10197) TaxID=511062 RepID=UPI000249551A|nr:exodeoxyribonuclease V subunit beta [Oceanimonas sp. GK1]AEY02025.1 exodeoxyribonuclease V, beta subunit [Oceanimonas sp. GK1]
MSPSRPLALTFPLHGSRLIEASAGTGKTFTISALYLRLVLGHGGEQGFARELLPPEILVVTFTDAATQELRDRIRARLVEAAAVFRGEAEGDELLATLRDDFPSEQWPGCAHRLDIAAQWMDEAAVSTIHGWCQRMLREHAFDSGSLFTQTLQTDHSELLAEVVRDYWRRQCYPLQGAALDWVIDHWQTPDALLPKLRPLLSEPGEADGELDALLEGTLSARARRLAELKAPWPAWADELALLLDKAVADKAVDGRKLQARYYQPWLNKLRAWAGSREADLALGTGFERLTPEGLHAIWKKGEPPVHPALEAMATLPGQLAALADPAEPALRHAAAWVRRHFELEKRRRAEMGFDDMLTRLDEALAGENGPRLAEVIRQQFPVALIDEFQDTDPLQYRIFDTIYRVADNCADSGLFMIGDPKQAIYAFRGADIYTYLSARAATEGRHYSLGTNFRSSTTMVAAVNRLFERAEAHPEGAFLFRDGEHNPLPFVSVQARGRDEHWQCEGAPQPALTLWQLDTDDDQPVAGGVYLEQMAARCASHMTHLLNLGGQGRAGFAGEHGLTPVQPSDMAVLVRSFREAQAIREALAARGVRSVYLSDKDSVFESPEAGDLLHWLRACAEPEQDGKLRAALATATLGLSLSELERLNQDERHWEGRVMQFRDYRRIWQRQGVLPMVHRLLHDFALPARLLRGTEGERKLTNLLHLAELMQQAAATLDGEQALIRHLADCREGERQAADEQVLRLESDAALVRVVTIHKSKGLEYPLVFLPFICSFRESGVRGAPVQLHEGGRKRLLLNPTDEQKAQAERERLGEDLRLLYVALTRARHACWLGLADIKVGNGRASRLHDSAMGRLLGGGAVLSGPLQDWLTPLASEHTALCAAPEVTGEGWVDTQRAPSAPVWASPARPAAEHWWIASYSALLSREEAGQRFDDAAPERPEAGKSGDDELERPFVPLRPFELPSLHRFPRGPAAGTFLHGLLELVLNEGLANQPEELASQLARRCQLRGLEEWATPLADWLQGLLATPLFDGGPALQALGCFQPEMEFWLEVSRVQIPALDALVRRHILPQRERPALAPGRLNGMLKGFIDLVFEHDGRYYVVDYKSNWLGPDDADYTRAAMEDQILRHRYDLQYVLYVLALHRQLILRLPDYDYDTHMGGALYLFVRRPGAVFAHRPPRELIESLNTLFCGATEESLP